MAELPEARGVARGRCSGDMIGRVAQEMRGSGERLTPGGIAGPVAAGLPPNGIFSAARSIARRVGPLLRGEAGHRGEAVCCPADRRDAA